jgi:hypothetical protein
VIHISAPQTEWTGVIHDQEVSCAAAHGALPLFDRGDDKQLGSLAGALRHALALLLAQVGRNPVGAVRSLNRRVSVCAEAQRPAIPGAGDVFALRGR